MNGMSASVQGIASPSASFVLLFLACAMASSQATGANGSGTLKKFHDDTLNITYFYPAEFMPTPAASTPALAGTSKCMQPTLFAYSVTPVEYSSFAVYTIDSTCPRFYAVRASSALSPERRSCVSSSSMAIRQSFRCLPTMLSLAILLPSP
jgi:hypothetical protein